MKTPSVLALFLAAVVPAAAADAPRTFSGATPLDPPDGTTLPRPARCRGGNPHGEVGHPDRHGTDRQPHGRCPVELGRLPWAPRLVVDSVATIAEYVEARELAEDRVRLLAETLLRGIRDDLDSRKDWIEDRAQGIKLLGLKIEIPGLQGASDGAPVEGMSKVRHPLLLEAVLRFQVMTHQLYFAAKFA